MSDNPEKCANYLRVVRFTIDHVTEAVRDFLYYYKARENIASFFSQKTILEELERLKRKHIITKDQYEKVISCENVDNFDLSLLLTLLTNIFAVMIEPPENGWNKPAEEHDTSLGAVLLRLKDIRNTIIGHKSSAKIDSDEYKYLWGRLENIFIKLKMFVSTESEESIKAKIEVYKAQALEPKEEIEERYANLIQRWHNDFITLQNEVERLCDRTTEFCLLFKTDIPERYSRYVLILYEGGMLVLTSTLHVKLKGQNKDLASLLAYNRNILALQVKKAKGVIFVSTSKINTDVSTWGISLLADVIIKLFHDTLTKPETKAIQGIKKANENYALIALASTDDDKFREHWTDIISHISTLSVLQNEETHNECQLLIKTHEKGQIDEDVVKHYIGLLFQEFREPNSLIELYKDTRRKLKDAIEAMIKSGYKFGKEHEIDLKMMTIGKSEEKRKLAEDVLYTVFQKANSATDCSENFQVLKEAVDKILDKIRNMDDVKIKSVEKHCILLTLKCSSATSFHDLIDYTISKPFFDEIENMSTILSNCFNDKISVTAFITLECMKRALDTISENDSVDDEPCTRLKLSVTSASAVENISKLIDDKDTENFMNDVAQGLSTYVNESVSLSSSLEMDGLSEVFANPLQSLRHSPWQPFLTPGYQAMRGLSNSSIHSAFFQRLIDDIQRPFTSIELDNVFNDDTELIHHAPVHRASSFSSMAERCDYHFIDTYNDSDLSRNQSNLFFSPISLGRVSSPVSNGDVTDDADETIGNWDFIRISSTSNSSRSSSVCSIVF